VSDHTPDGRLQDYLDGRLDETERARFEERLREDSELAERVRILEEARRVLREEPAELPPGFHARTRARFEETAGRRRSVWHRIVSWEAAGLAVATLVLAAFLLPVIWERGMAPEELAPAAPARNEQLPAVGGLTEAEGTPELDETVAAGDDEAEKEERSGVPRQTVPADPEDDPPSAFAAAPNPRAKKADVVVEEKTGGVDRNSIETRRREDAFAPAPPPAEAAPAPRPKAEDKRMRAAAEPESPGDVAARADADAEARKELVEEIRKAVREEERRAVDEYRQALEDVEVRGGKGTGHESRVAQSEPAPPPPLSHLVVVDHARSQDVKTESARWAPLPSDFFLADETDLVRSSAEWGALLRARGNGALYQLDVDFRIDRVVLVRQTEPPFDCSRVLVVVLDREATLSLPDADENDARTGGCAVVVPASTETVRIDRTEWE
jgi:hypothetical protein